MMPGRDDPTTARSRAGRVGLLGLAAVLAVAAVPSTGLAQTVSTPPDGQITVQKVLVGDSFLADDVEIRVRCEQLPEFGDASYDQTQTIPAGSTVISVDFTGVPAPADCTITETSDGSNAGVAVEVDGLPAEVRLNPNETVVIGVTNEYTELAGDLEITKTVEGPAADRRGPVEVRVECTDGTVQTLTLPPDASGSVSVTVGPIVAGSECTVTEVVDGGGPDLVVVTTPSTPQVVTITDDTTTDVRISNAYTAATGSVRVAKEIGGPAAGQQDGVDVALACSDGSTATVSVPAGQPTGTTVGDPITVPAGVTCAAVETADGSNETVSVTATVPDPIVVTAGSDATVTVVNAYQPAVVPTVPIAVDIVKRIGGPAIGSQGPVALLLLCDDGTRSTVFVPAGSPGGRYPSTSGPRKVESGTTCRVIEQLDGATSSVAVTTSGRPGPFVVTEDTTITVDNRYELRPGSVLVTKIVDGPGAALHRAIEVTVDCDDGTSDVLSVPAGVGPSSTGLLVEDLPAGTTCDLAEPLDGDGPLIDVSTVLPGPVEIVAGSQVDAVVVDTYRRSERGHVLVVFQQIAGVSSDLRDTITVRVRCGDDAPVERDYPPGAELVPIIVPNRLPGESCIVEEVVDGSRPGLAATVAPADERVVTIEDDLLTVARILTTYDPELPSLTVTKEIVGAAAPSHSGVGIEIECESQFTTLTVPAGATEPASVVLDGLYPPEVCTVTETNDGAVDGVVSVVTDLDPAGTIETELAVDRAVTVRNEYAAVAPPVTLPPTTLPPTLPPVTLPPTGSGAGGSLAAGFAAVLGGTALLWLARRTRPRPWHPTLQPVSDTSRKVRRRGS